MSDRVIEPSEIIIEKGYEPKEDITHVNPWVRCIARYVDYSLFFLLLLASRHLFSGKLPFGQAERLIPFEFFVWIPFEALLLSTWGTTPGKFLLRTKIKAKKRKKIDFSLALRRSFAVWVRGIGVGIPFLNAFCMLVAYHKLQLLKMTSWDRDESIQITHYPIGKWRLYFAVFIAIGGILYYYGEKGKELKNGTQIVRSFDEHSPSKIPQTRSPI